MMRLMEVASKSETFVKLYLEKSKSKNVNRHELFDCPAAGDTLEVFSLDRPPLLAVIAGLTIQSAGRRLATIRVRSTVAPDQRREFFAAQLRNSHSLTAHL